jgi:hypothetical protein
MSADWPDIAGAGACQPNSDSPPTGDRQQRLLALRTARNGYLSGNTGDPQKPCDAAGYPVGFHTWELERRNAWWCAWNLGAVERDA